MNGSVKVDGEIIFKDYDNPDHDCKVKNLDYTFASNARGKGIRVTYDYEFKQDGKTVTKHSDINIGKYNFNTFSCSFSAEGENKVNGKKFKIDISVVKPAKEVGLFMLQKIASPIMDVNHKVMLKVTITTGWTHKDISTELDGMLTIIPIIQTIEEVLG